jgi:hypothetical protein
MTKTIKVEPGTPSIPSAKEILTQRKLDIRSYVEERISIARKGRWNSVTIDHNDLWLEEELRKDGHDIDVSSRDLTIWFARPRTIYTAEDHFCAGCVVIVGVFLLTLLYLIVGHRIESYNK